jgi:hypothetical protein
MVYVATSLPAAQVPQRGAGAPAANVGGMTVADYERALDLAGKYDGQVVDAPDAPTWLPSDRFWYRKSVRGGNAFVLVDPATATKPAFDHARLAAALSLAAGKRTATKLPFVTFALPTTSAASRSAATTTSPDVHAGRLHVRARGNGRRYRTAGRTWCRRRRARRQAGAGARQGRHTGRVA